MSSNDNLKKLSAELNRLIFTLGSEISSKPITNPELVVPTFFTFQDLDRFVVSHFRETMRVPDVLEVSPESYAFIMNDLTRSSLPSFRHFNANMMVLHTSVGPVQVYARQSQRSDNITFTWSFNTTNG